MTEMKNIHNDTFIACLRPSRSVCLHLSHAFTRIIYLNCLHGYGFIRKLDCSISLTKHQSNLLNHPISCFMFMDAHLAGNTAVAPMTTPRANLRLLALALFITLCLVDCRASFGQ